MDNHRNSHKYYMYTQFFTACSNIMFQESSFQKFFLDFSHNISQNMTFSKEDANKSKNVILVLMGSKRDC